MEKSPNDPLPGSAWVGLIHEMPRKPKNNVDPSTPEEVERSINYKNIEHDEETRSEGKI